VKQIYQITKQEIDEALEKNRVWDLGNRALYDLCSSHPHHKTNEEIIAKVWLIGRAYSAAIERRKNKDLDSPGDFFYENKVAPAIKNSEIDDWFDLLKNYPTPENAIAIHFRLTKLFCDISKLEKRSLASKYLHFHFRKLFLFMTRDLRRRFFFFLLLIPKHNRRNFHRMKLIQNTQTSSNGVCCLNRIYRNDTVANFLRANSTKY